MRLPTIATLAAVLALSAVAHEAEAGARRSRPLKTGQTTCTNVAGVTIPCAGTGEDGDLQRGEPRAYQDNGDGTIRDKRTALTWEKISDDGSVHDKDSLFTWLQAFGKIDTLNTPPCFAGFCDWRLPSCFELFTLVNLGNGAPAVSTPFKTGCTPACTVLTCSCTYSAWYWTSSDNPLDHTLGFEVYFGSGAVTSGPKTGTAGVRAVRGGS
jgi:hypothetical protein